MKVKIFNIAIPGGEEIVEEMNKFILGKRILHVENQVVLSGQQAFWTFCVKYLEEDFRVLPKKKKVDYRNVLDDESFKRFVQMRDIRKKLSDEEGIPAYLIFTNEELAELAKMEELTLVNMKKVKGIGEKKTEKYGSFFLKL